MTRQVARYALLGWSLLASASIAANPAATTKLPKWEQVQAAVNDYFRTLPGYQPGGIVTRTDVRPAFPQLEKLGWAVADREAILTQLPAEGDFLVQQLRTPAGRKFATRIATIPDGYDRLERLSRLPSGRATVRDLIGSKGGDKLIEYLATTPGGNELGKMLSKDSNGPRFNQPTGKIYTAEQVLARLKRSYAEATGTEPTAAPR